MWPAPQSPPPPPAAPKAADTAKAQLVVEAEPADPQTEALVDGGKAALATLAFVALGVSTQGQHDFTEMLTILTLVSFSISFRVRQRHTCSCTYPLTFNYLREYAVRV